MPNIQYYDILEISPDASAAMVRSAYRKLSRKYHPDSNPDAEGIQHFKKIQEAREVLLDSTKRAQYDQQLKETNRPGGKLVNAGDCRAKFCTEPGLAGAYSAPAREMYEGSTSARDNNEQIALTVWPIKNAKTAVIAMIGVILSCSLLTASLILKGTTAANARSTEHAGSESHSFTSRRPPGAVVKGNLAAWTEPARPRYGDEYRIMLTVHMLTTDRPVKVNEIIEGHIVGSDGLRQDIPYHAGAPNASWMIVADRDPERITSPTQIVTASARSVHFSFEVPAATSPTRDSILVRSNLLPSSKWWELVVNRNR